MPVTTVGGRTIHVNDEGLIDDFMVMVRPLSGATALSEAMAAQFPQIQAEAAEAIAALSVKVPEARKQPRPIGFKLPKEEK